MDFSPRDLSILTVLARLDGEDDAQRDRLLDSLSDSARPVGDALVQEPTDQQPDRHAELAAAIKDGF